MFQNLTSIFFLINKNHKTCDSPLHFPYSMSCYPTLTRAYNGKWSWTSNGSLNDSLNSIWLYCSGFALYVKSVQYCGRQMPVVLSYNRLHWHPFIETTIVFYRLPDYSHIFCGNFSILNTTCAQPSYIHPHISFHKKNFALICTVSCTSSYHVTKENKLHNNINHELIEEFCTAV